MALHARTFIVGGLANGSAVSYRTIEQTCDISCPWRADNDLVLHRCNGLVPQMVSVSQSEWFWGPRPYLQ